ncbi:MAG: hypothetical protein KDD69_12065 [Bdellovibrionales bacterium]|nr:hypothetical protein [Bdellovibrionales bacterium]
MLPFSHRIGGLRRAFTLRGLTLALLFSGQFLLSGCFLAQHRIPDTPAPFVGGALIKAPHAPNIIEARVSRTWREPIRKRAPVEVKVTQAFFEESDLKVKVHLTALTPLKTEQVLVAVAGLQEGEVVEEHQQRLNEVLGGEYLRQGQTAALLFSLETGSLTEYQVRCSWGDSALSGAAGAGSSEPTSHSEVEHARGRLRPPSAENLLQPERPPLVKGRSVTLDNVDIVETPEHCDHPPCNVYFVVHADLVSGGVEPIDGLELALGLYWATQGTLPKLPEIGAELTANEELIDLSTLRLGPGETRRIRVKVDRSVPVVPGGSFIPHLRILPSSLSEY